MCFGLRNAGATYQRCIQKYLHDQIGKIVQVYVDDIVIKTKEKHTLLDDLKETFANLRKFQLNLNPDKCTFGVPTGKLLGFLVSRQGIEANPTKIRAIENMKLPRCPHHPDLPSRLRPGLYPNWRRGPVRPRSPAEQISAW